MNIVYLIIMNNLVIFTVLYNNQTAKFPLETIHKKSFTYFSWIMFDITVQWHHDILRSWQLSHFKKKSFWNSFFGQNSQKTWDRSWVSLYKRMDKPVLFSQRWILRQLFRIDPKRIVVARNLFFFSILFSKNCEIILKKP